MKLKFLIISIFPAVLLLASCDKTQSYSDLLKKEQKVSNWFLAQQTVRNDIPADSVFLEGSDAPFYRMDNDGYVYMQVVTAPEKNKREIPSYDDQVYFTYTRYNIETMYQSNTLDVAGQGNQDNLLNAIGSTYFFFKNYNVSSSSAYGSGIQIPVSYLGYNSEVNILLKSYYGFLDDATSCIPYLVNVRYFKAEY